MNEKDISIAKFRAAALPFPDGVAVAAFPRHLYQSSLRSAATTTRKPAKVPKSARAKNIGKLEELCRQARREFGASCLWWLSERQPGAAGWQAIAKALSTYGGHSGMVLARTIEEAARAADAVSDRGAADARRVPIGG